MLFDQQEYTEKSWRTALSGDYYVRLGLDNMPAEMITEAAVREAYQLRYKWWNHMHKLLSSGQHPPVIGKVGPFINEAFGKLSEARDALSNPEKKRVYDEGRAREQEDQWVSEIRSMLKIALVAGKLYTKNRDNILEQCIEKGIPADKAAALIAAEVQGQGISLVDENQAQAAATIQTPDLPRGNYFEMLGLTVNASLQDLEEAYRREKKLYINDRNKTRASARFALVSRAYETLHNPIKRRQYVIQLEQQLHSESTPTLKGTVPGLPRLELALAETGQTPDNFQIRLKRGGVTSTPVVVAKNGGGGALEAKITTNVPWLDVVDYSTGVVLDKVVQGKLPQRFFCRVVSSRDKKLGYGAKQTGEIRFEYSHDGRTFTRTITVTLEIETLAERVRLATGIALAVGGLLGWAHAYYLFGDITHFLSFFLGIPAPPLEKILFLSISFLALFLPIGFKVGGLKPGRILTILCILGFLYLVDFYTIISKTVPHELLFTVFVLPALLLGVLPLPLNVFLVRRISSVRPERAVMVALLVSACVFFAAWLGVKSLPWVAAPEIPVYHLEDDYSLQEPVVVLQSTDANNAVYLLQDAEDMAILLKFTDQCWVRAQQDGKLVTEKTFSAGQELYLGDSEETRLRLGYPLGVEIEVNGNPLDVPAELSAPCNLMVIKEPKEIKEPLSFFYPPET